jgi:hypothetical protein
VKNRRLLFLLVPFLILILFFSCRKINSATDIGGGLIPPIDNITTFDTTLNVEVYNEAFSLLNDSTRYAASLNINNTFLDYILYLGKISNDPFFGKTNAELYFQLKPTFFKYTFSNKPDSLHIDSIVLVLSFNDIYGDTNTAQTVNVYEIDQSSSFKADSAYLVRQSSITKGNLLGSRSFLPTILDDSVKVFQDTTRRQLRIRLDDSFGDRLLKYDTSGANNAYSSDSIFNTKFKGFALESTSGNALMGFDLKGDNTKLAIYYRDDNGDALVEDTLVAYFSFNEGFSASANYITRDYAGSPLAAAIGGAGSDDMVYIQSTPGTFATIKIPGLAGLNNRVVHRAELIMEQAYDISDSTFPPPDYLYLDAYDPTESKYRTIPYDFNFDVSGRPNLPGLGAISLRYYNQLNNPINVWRFNLSRYVQNVVNGKEPVYDLRLFAPIYFYNQYKASSTSTSTTVPVIINPAIATGRVRLYGNDGTNNNPQRMRLRIVYSKI